MCVLLNYLWRLFSHTEHCPTKEMVADLLTKPLQGDLFRTLRDMLLGYTSRDGSDSSVGETNQGV